MKGIGLALVLALGVAGSAGCHSVPRSCVRMQPLDLGVPIPRGGSFVGVESPEKVVWDMEVGCRENADEVLGTLRKLIGPPAKKMERTDGDTHSFYYLWENASTSLGLMVRNQGTKWRVTLGFSRALHKV
jgi:hypothetical protein